MIVLRQEEQGSAFQPLPSQDASNPRTRYQGVILKDSRVLLIRHQEHASGRDYWIIPGGGRLDGESEEDCVDTRDERRDQPAGGCPAASSG